MWLLVQHGWLARKGRRLRPLDTLSFATEAPANHRGFVVPPARE